ncbi:MAG: phosphopantothenoylcysteine decarboxylase [Phycisphaerales bacterium]|jgi:phosphopantothenoylcysteine decarboxylase/phosphopantothenate--cysteine ligase|nr:phosphopantothenoylcysteine decarboxylase [Phycisphaerales bacterium]
MVAILITAGPTREYLDDVRYLSNGSSGRMGFALAVAALAAGHQPTLVLGPTELSPPAGAAVVRVVSALEMQAAAERAFAAADVVIAAAAVSDWRPARRAPGKPPKPASGGQSLELVANPDIVAGLAAKKGRRVVAGFGLESAAAGMPAAIARGRRKLVAKGLDLVVVNLHDAIGSEQADFVLCHADGRDEALPRGGKDAAATRIVAAAVQLWRERATT